MTQQQFSPLATIPGGTEGIGNWRPVLDLNGIPIWQPGDTEPIRFDITAAGQFRAAPKNLRNFDDLKGSVYVTGARIIVVASGFNKGSHYRAVGIPSLSELALNATANRVSKSKARKSEAGTFLAGHMRLPWISQVIWAPASSGRNSRGSVRIVGVQRSPFGDQESVALCFRLSRNDDVLPFVSSVLSRITSDRQTFERTSDSARASLQALPQPGTVVAQPGQLASVNVPGGWLITGDSGYLGTVSVMSKQSVG